LSKALIEFGCSCAGKGVVGKKIKQLVGDSLTIISTGEYFRSHKELCGHAHNGLLIENRHVMEFFRNEILGCKQGDIILDSPRTHDQVVLLADMLKQFGYTTIASVYVDTSITNCKKRMEARAHKEHRDDDRNMKAIQTRLDNFLVESPSVVTALQQYTDPYFHANGDKDLAGLESEASVIAHEVFGCAHPKIHHVIRSRERSIRSGPSLSLSSRNHHRH